MYICVKNCSEILRLNEIQLETNQSFIKPVLILSSDLWLESQYSLEILNESKFVQILNGFIE